MAIELGVWLHAPGGSLCRDPGTLDTRNKNQLCDYMTTEPARLAGIPALWCGDPGWKFSSLTNGRGSRVQCRGRGSKDAVAGPKSRSRVQYRGGGSNVAARENDLDFEVTEWKRLIRKKYKGKKSRFYARYSTVANLQVRDVRVNKIMSQEKT